MYTLRVDGNLISDPLQLKKAWTQHFRNLTQSQIGSNPALLKLQRFLPSLMSSCFQKEEVFLDVPFSEEEVEHAVSKLKLK